MLNNLTGRNAITKIQKKRIREYFQTFDGPGNQSKFKLVIVNQYRTGVVEVKVTGLLLRKNGYRLTWAKWFKESYVINSRGKELYI